MWVVCCLFMSCKCTEWKFMCQKCFKNQLRLQNYRYWTSHDQSKLIWFNPTQHHQVFLKLGIIMRQCQIHEQKTKICKFWLHHGKHELKCILDQPVTQITMSHWNLHILPHSATFCDVARYRRPSTKNAQVAPTSSDLVRTLVRSGCSRWPSWEPSRLAVWSHAW